MNDREKELTETIEELNFQLGWYQSLEQRECDIEKSDMEEVPSEEEKRQMIHKLKKVGKPVVSRKRLAVILLASACLLTITVKAAFPSIANFFTRVFDEYVSISSYKNTGEKMYLSPDDVPIPSYLPDGFMISQTVRKENYCYIEMQKENMDTIYYCFYEKGGINVDYEKAISIKDVIINRMEGLLIVYPKSTTILWGVEPTYLLSGNSVSNEELIKIAESIGEVEN